MPKAERGFKRMLVVNDWHCGHLNGLTPPEYNSNAHPGYEYRQEVWANYIRDINSLRPFDAIVANGDLVDGKGKGEGEHLSNNIDDQKRIALSVMKAVIGKDMPAVVIIAGTDFHTVSDGSNLEKAIAELLIEGGKCREVLYGNQEVVDMNGVKFHFRHHIGNGQGNAVPPSLPRQKLNNLLWADRGRQEAYDVFVRGHIHRYVHLADATTKYVVCPAMQGGTNYGARRCDTIVDLGFCYFDVFDDKETICRPILYRPKTDVMVPVVI